MAWGLVATAWLTAAAGAAEPDNAVRFGAREGAWGASLSPDGTRLAYLTPTAGRGTALAVLTIDGDPQHKVPLRSSGSPEHLRSCSWVSNARLVCTVTAITKTDVGLTPFSRIMAVDADGANLKMLSVRQGLNDHGVQLNGGEVIDWLPDEDGAVLMNRNYLANDQTGTHIGTDRSGLAVDRIDTRTLKATHVESSRRSADQYISDGRGAVRIVGLTCYDSNGFQTGTETYLYRRKGVAIAQSTTMAAKLRAAGGKVQLVTFDGLDHQLDDSAARTKLLTDSDAFLKASTGS